MFPATRRKPILAFSDGKDKAWRFRASVADARSIGIGPAVLVLLLGDVFPCLAASTWWRRRAAIGLYAAHPQVGSPARSTRATQSQGAVWPRPALTRLLAVALPVLVAAAASGGSPAGARRGHDSMEVGGNPGLAPPAAHQRRCNRRSASPTWSSSILRPRRRSLQPLPRGARRGPEPSISPVAEQAHSPTWSPRRELCHSSQRQCR